MFKSYPALVAELSANHNKSLKRALNLLKLAKQNDADAVKLQTFDESSMTINTRRNGFLIKSGLWRGYSLWDLYKDAKTPFSWHKELFDYAKKIKIKCFSTPFDLNALNLLEKLNCPIYKIASFEATDLELIKEVSMTQKPMIISTGLCNIKEIDNAFNTAKKYNSNEVALLYCVSSYPSKISDFNLENISILKKRYKCRVGFSDHSKKNIVAQLAVSMGATIIEKHIAENNQKRGLDIEFSLKGNEIKKFKEDILTAKHLIGEKYFKRTQNEKKNLIFRRSIYATKNIKKGEKFTKTNTKTLRPYLGICASKYQLLLNKKAKRNIKENTTIYLKDLK
mgnify:CR=1 FL=1|tara:strand:+ start:1075 stop:2088 length:1014 start_codon:yes stop_codon:yes gene_type:complete